MVDAGPAPLSASRWTPYVETFRFKGVDLTDAVFHAQVRLTPDAAGTALINLGTVTGIGAQGLRLVQVDSTGVVPVSTVEMCIDETTLADVAHAPAAATVGDDVQLAWDLHVTEIAKPRQRWLSGSFTVLAGVTRP